MTLAEARKYARDAQAAIDRGDDPGAPHHGREMVDTFDALADLYLKRYSRPNKRTWATDERLLKRDIRPVIGHLPIDRITRSDVLATLDKVASRNAPIQTERVYETIRGVFRWGLSEDYIKNDPTFGMKRRSKKQPRDRVLTDAEITKLWHGLDKTTLDPRSICALKLTLATGQRIGEICGAEISEFDTLRKTWSLPGRRTKNAKPHELPLSPLAIELVEDAMVRFAGDHFLFASTPRNRVERGNEEQPLQASSVSKAFARVRDRMGLGGEPVTPHDFRRTVATFMQRSGVSEAVVARILNHRSETTRTVTAAVYMQHAFTEEKKEAIRLWDEHLRALTNEQPTHVVTRLHNNARSK